MLSPPECSELFDCQGSVLQYLCPTLARKESQSTHVVKQCWMFGCAYASVVECLVWFQFFVKFA